MDADIPAELTRRGRTPAKGGIRASDSRPREAKVGAQHEESEARDHLQTQWQKPGC
jgi:hypothetical protein